MRPPLVEVIWHDAFGSANWRSRESVLGEFHPTPYACCSVGWLVKSDKIGVTYASTFGGEDDLNGVHHVPRGMIQKETILQKGKK